MEVRYFHQYAAGITGQNHSSDFILAKSYSELTSLRNKMIKPYHRKSKDRTWCVGEESLSYHISKLAKADINSDFYTPAGSKVYTAETINDLFNNFEQFFKDFDNRVKSAG